MANEENLIPFDSNQSREQAKKNGRKGGIKSGQVKRERKTMKEMLNYLLSQDITDKKGNKKNTLEAVMVAQIREALKGNTKAIQFIRDTIGEMPIAKQEITGKNGEPLSVKKIFVTPDEVKEAEKHIQDIIE